MPAAVHSRESGQQDGRQVRAAAWILPPPFLHPSRRLCAGMGAANHPDTDEQE